MKDFAGKTAVVTGAASGIGRCLALDFARRGMRVVAADVEAGPLEAVRGEIEAAGAQALAVPTDVTRHASVRALADAAWERFGAVHVLCNNAGVALAGDLARAGLKDWEWVLGVNLWGVIHGVECFVPRMIEQGAGGHMVNTASMAGLIASKGLGIYNTSKYAVVGLSETLHKELRDHGIGVSVLCPMGVHTGISEAERNRPTALRDEGPAAPVPQLMGRYLEPETVSARVLEAIEAGQLYVLTHHEGREPFRRRADRILQAFPEE